MIWSGDQIEDVADDFSYSVAQGLENALEDKERQIKWSNSIADLSKRFQDIISLDGLTAR